MPEQSDFDQLKSTKDAEISRLQKQVASLTQRVTSQEQQLSSYESEIGQLPDGDDDVPGRKRLKAILDSSRQERQAVEQRRQQLRETILSNAIKLSKEHGLDVEDLAQADSIEAQQMLVIAHLAQLKPEADAPADAKPASPPGPAQSGTTTRTSGQMWEGAAKQLAAMQQSKTVITTPPKQ